eukprot:15178015-Ditylum_brightwellii.AAC.1
MPEGDGIDQPKPSRCSARNLKPTALFDPDIGLARNWSLDMAIKKALILNNHESQVSCDET